MAKDRKDVRNKVNTKQKTQHNANLWKIDVNKLEIREKLTKLVPQPIQSFNICER